MFQVVFFPVAALGRNRIIALNNVRPVSALPVSQALGILNQAQAQSNLSKGWAGSFADSCDDWMPETMTKNIPVGQTNHSKVNILWIPQNRTSCPLNNDKPYALVALFSFHLSRQSCPRQLHGARPSGAGFEKLLFHFTVASHVATQLETAGEGR